MDRDEIHLLFNTILGTESMKDSSVFRRKAVEKQIPYYTTIAAIVAASKAIVKLQNSSSENVRSIQDHIVNLRSISL